MSSMRHVGDVVLYGIVKDGALSLHASWTFLVNSMVTTKGEIEQLIFTRGGHLETKFATAQFETNNSPAAFLRSTNMSDTGSIHEQVVALTIELRSMRKPGTYEKGGRGRGRGRGSSWDSMLDTRECYEIVVLWTHPFLLTRRAKEQEEA